MTEIKIEDFPGKQSIRSPNNTQPYCPSGLTLAVTQKRSSRAGRHVAGSTARRPHKIEMSSPSSVRSHGQIKCHCGVDYDDADEVAKAKGPLQREGRIFLLRAGVRTCLV